MKYFVIALVLTFICSNLYAQPKTGIINMGSQTLVKGIVTDIESGKPVGTNVEFRDKSGKKIKIQSNSMTGAFEQLLNAGEQYEVLIQSWNVARKTYNLTVEKSDKYIEQKVDFQIRKLEKDNIFMSINAFNANTANTNEEVKQMLEELNTTLKFNRGVEFTVYINAIDLPEPVKSEPASKKSKKKSKEKEVKVQDNSKFEAERKKLVDDRIEQIKKALETLGANSKKLTVHADYSNSRSAKTNLIIVCSKVEDVLNK